MHRLVISDTHRRQGWNYVSSIPIFVVHSLIESWLLGWETAFEREVVSGLSVSLLFRDYVVRLVPHD